jgi:pimeloyl-ACP methyl ester carboxylesterase
MMRAAAGAFAALFIAAAAPQSESSGPRAACIPAPVGADSFCTVKGVRIHYVDWGGRGPAIILLSGLGDSARIFDDLAPRLAHGHRVLALTRRGYGLSDQQVSDFSNAALVGDVLGIMDALAIPRASFVGHSIAGGELSSLGEHYPRRVLRLVYLDSAYDRSKALELTKNVPAVPGPTAADRASLEALTHWRQAVLGASSAAIKDDLRDTTRMKAGGLVARAPASTTLAVLAGDVAATPRYSTISAPALALYSSKDVTEQVPPSTTQSRRREVVDYFVHRIRPWMLRAQADFLERKRCGVAVELPGSTHYFFLIRPEWTAKTVLSFVDSKDPCHFAPRAYR